jgi:putative PIN family toxin of toxin-antitoxin system
LSNTLPRVVFDAVVYVQALISGRGPAAACIERILSGKAILFLSDAILAEITDVPLRPELTRRYSHLTPAAVTEFVRELRAVAVHVPAPAKAFVLSRDPKDEPYTDLSVAVRADYLVTWNDRHLTYLMRRDTPESKDFCAKFPWLKILSPPDFLGVLAQLGQDDSGQST